LATACGHAQSPAAKCSADSGLSLPPGFCATIFADNIGHARHLAVAADGTVYANTWSGQYFKNSPPPAGGMIVALKDNDGDGVADIVARLGQTPAQGATGGSGVALYKGYVYVESGDQIVRYRLAPGGLGVAGPVETVVSGMPMGGNHPMHPFVIDPKGQIFVDMGSATNACQAKDRQVGEPGLDPCTELETRAGVWRFDANKPGQAFASANRYATGIRNGEGFAFDAAGRLFVTQHGRDGLQSWTKFYDNKAVELPAEVFFEVKQGGDYAWPNCYYDGQQKKNVLAPEFGGDGGKAVGICATKSVPAAVFPAHWAPNDLAFYQGKMFPAAYKGGAFVAFHGSWNRAPTPQQGYNVVFQPMKDGKANGPWLLFADGFAGAKRDPGGAAFRPGGLATAPDGALYIADDVKGRIWRVAYHGPANAAPAAALASAVAAAALATPATPATGTDAAQLALGDRIYHGQASGGTCAGCHGSDGGGTSFGANLKAAKYLWSDGSLAGIRKTIVDGVPTPKESDGVMPPRGGSSLTDSEVDAVTAYVWKLAHPAG
jgi:glucose/arabinose dehydrogenase